MRKAMGWKAKGLARHLGVTAEHLSRCESSTKVMAGATEKLFRLYCLLKTPDKAALAELEMASLFDIIEIEQVWDVSKKLTFHFVRQHAVSEPVHEGDEKWRKDKNAGFKAA
jgi:transcriptional regulator with XRE-family HTH domain